jgi:uncharacterized protein YbjT (DUF2867 family)
MILVTGATGFVGGHLVRRLLVDGCKVRALVRGGAPPRDLPVHEIEFAAGDVTDRDSLCSAMKGVETVVHLVGVIAEHGHASFEAVHVNGTRNVVEAASKTGVHRLVHMSALGTRPQATCRYHQTKWQAEQLVRSGGDAGNSTYRWTILRPSVIFGEGDGFTAAVRSLLGMGPFIPIAGDGSTRLQPIFIDDLVASIAWCLARDEALGQTYELGGPEHLTFERVVDILAHHLGVQKRKLRVPIALMFLMSCAQEVLARSPRVTVDQLKMMSEDNICELTVLSDTFGIEPTRLEDVLKTYL